jgi:hypothetical protein
MCAVASNDNWVSLASFGNTPMLTPRGNRPDEKVADTATVERKGQKRKFIKTDSGQMYKIRRCDFSEIVTSNTII